MSLTAVVFAGLVGLFLVEVWWLSGAILRSVIRAQAAIANQQAKQLRELLQLADDVSRAIRGDRR